MIPSANIMPADGPPTLSSWMVTSNGKSKAVVSVMPISHARCPSTSASRGVTSTVPFSPSRS